MTVSVKSFGSFLASRAGAAVLRDAGYYAIGAGLLVAGLVGLRDFAPNDGIWKSVLQSSPLIATAAGAVWAVVKA